MYKPELNLQTAHMDELIAEVLALRSDLALITSMFVTEARNRDWCGEYEQWVRIVNRRTSRPHFIVRQELFNDDELPSPPRIIPPQPRDPRRFTAP